MTELDLQAPPVTTAPGDIWVFGYGSLMWNPGFAFRAAVIAVLPGFHRSLCVQSVVHRGTYKRPGLVFGLNTGGTCDGVAFLVAAADVPRALDYLRGRELVTGVYREAHQVIDLHGRWHTSARATCFVVQRSHRQYAGDLPRSVEREVVQAAVGRAGPNAEYVVRTVDRMAEMGVRDRALERLAGALRTGPGRPGTQPIAPDNFASPGSAPKLVVSSYAQARTEIRRSGRMSAAMLAGRPHPLPPITPDPAGRGFQARLAR